MIYVIAGVAAVAALVYVVKFRGAGDAPSGDDVKRAVKKPAEAAKAAVERVERKAPPAVRSTIEQAKSKAAEKESSVRGAAEAVKSTAAAAVDGGGAKDMSSRSALDKDQSKAPATAKEAKSEPRVIKTIVLGIGDEPKQPGIVQSVTAVPEQQPQAEAASEPGGTQSTGGGGGSGAPEGAGTAAANASGTEVQTAQLPVKPSDTAVADSSAPPKGDQSQPGADAPSADVETAQVITDRSAAIVQEALKQSDAVPSPTSNEVPPQQSPTASAQLKQSELPVDATQRLDAPPSLPIDTTQKPEMPKPNEPKKNESMKEALKKDDSKKGDTASAKGAKLSKRDDAQNISVDKSEDVGAAKGDPDKKKKKKHKKKGSKKSEDKGKGSKAEKKAKKAKKDKSKKGKKDKSKSEASPA